MKKILLSLLFLQSVSSFAQKMEIIPLGVYGGGDESNLSSYLIGVENSASYLCLDAGTLRSGINKSIQEGTFTVDMTTVLREYIKGYFVSHGHLDHVSGLIINSPEDQNKIIYGLPFVIDVLKNNYFTNAAWTNFANEGDTPMLGKYHYQRLKPKEAFNIENTTLSAEVLELSHVNPQKSSALLVRNNDEYILYFGDTGADRVEKTNHLNEVWDYIAPLVQNGNLKTILIEVSFPNSQPEDKLFGHLTPNLLMEELGKLGEKTGTDKLQNLNIVITHLKPDGDQIALIKQQLQANNPYQVNLLFPQQGKKLKL